MILVRAAAGKNINIVVEKENKIQAGATILYCPLFYSCVRPFKMERNLLCG